LISLMTSPVLGSIRLTGDAAPCEPNWFSMARKRADFADRLYWGEAPILGSQGRKIMTTGLETREQHL
jgi:hypothetical protein